MHRNHHRSAKRLNTLINASVSTRQQPPARVHVRIEGMMLRVSVRQRKVQESTEVTNQGWRIRLAHELTIAKESYIGYDRLPLVAPPAGSLRLRNMLPPAGIAAAALSASGSTLTGGVSVVI